MATLDRRTASNLLRRARSLLSALDEHGFHFAAAKMSETVIAIEEAVANLPTPPQLH